MANEENIKNENENQEINPEQQSEAPEQKAEDQKSPEENTAKEQSAGEEQQPTAQEEESTDDTPPEKVEENETAALLKEGAGSKEEETVPPAETAEQLPEDTEKPAEEKEDSAEKSEEPKAEAEVTDTKEAVEAKEGAEKEAMEEAAPESEAMEEKPAEEKEQAAEKKEETPAAEEKEGESDKEGAVHQKTKRERALEERQRKMDEAYAELREHQEKNEPVEAKVVKRIRGGLRMLYKDLQCFLPASHVTMKRNPDEEELQKLVGSTINVYIHETDEDEFGRKTVIVSRKKLIEDEFWNSITEGDVVEGKVSSIANFGVFVDIGGVEGLIHISRLSQVHVEDPKEFVEKGQTIRTVIVDVDRERKRIALSRKELEESPWKGVEEEFPAGTRAKGIIRRLTDFGAYVELKPGIDGLLRTNEISWTKRVRKPEDVFETGQEIEVEVMSVSEEKQTVGLSYRRTQPNPWPEMKDKYPVGTELEGLIDQVVPQGAIVTLGEDIDGFMPRSKIKPLMRGKRIPFKPGESVKVKVADLVPEEESLILAPVVDEETLSKKTGGKKTAPTKEKTPSDVAEEKAFTLGDLLSDKDKNNLNNINE